MAYLVSDKKTYYFSSFNSLAVVKIIFCRAPPAHVFLDVSCVSSDPIPRIMIQYKSF